MNTLNGAGNVRSMYIRAHLLRDRRWSTRPLVVDVTVTAGLLAVTLYEGLATPVGWRPFDAEAYLLTIAAVLPLMTRRYAPTWSMLVCGSCWLVYILAGYWPVANAYAYLLMLYTVAALRPRRYALGGVLLGVAVWGIGGSLLGSQNLVGVLAQGLIVQATVCWAG